MRPKRVLGSSHTRKRAIIVVPLEMVKRIQFYGRLADIHGGGGGVEKGSTSRNN